MQRLTHRDCGSLYYFKTLMFNCVLRAQCRTEIERGMLYCVDLILSDIDECMENTGNCSQNCNNTIGSYQCLCDDGFLLDSDGASCNGMGVRFFLFFSVILVTSYELGIESLDLPISQCHGCSSLPEFFIVQLLL